MFGGPIDDDEEDARCSCQETTLTQELDRITPVGFEEFLKAQMMIRRRFEIWKLGYGIEFHWTGSDGVNYFAGPFENGETAAAYFELRWMRGDREKAFLVPYTGEGKRAVKEWSKAKEGLNLSLSFQEIEERFN